MIKRERIQDHATIIEKLYRKTSNPINYLCPSVTLQVTDDCCCNCTYCYQGNKNKHYMTPKTAIQIIDYLFNLYEKDDPNNLINRNTVGITLEFIGGEPLMNIEAIDAACTHFLNYCLKHNHPWLRTFRLSMISNGKYYFDPKVQSFLNRFNGFLSFGITLDGPEDIHDRCRRYFDGTGNFKDAYAALKYHNEHFDQIRTTKATIAPQNLLEINKLVDFFVNEAGATDIFMNPVFEAQWTDQEASIYYQELKKMSDKLLKINQQDKSIINSIFEESIGQLLENNETANWCGGTGAMLSFDYQGKIYPCIRYMESSLGKDQKPIIIGSIYPKDNTKDNKKIYHENLTTLKSITRQSQSTQECLNCPIASGCAWCSGWNYQLYGTANKRCTYICPMHKARVLANVYYWNKFYDIANTNEVFELNLPKKECLKFIDENEYNMLLSLVQKQKDKINQINN